MTQTASPPPPTLYWVPTPLLTAVNTNNSKLLQPDRSLSIDEIMVKFYGRSVLRQYIKAKPNK